MKATLNGTTFAQSASATTYIGIHGSYAGSGGTATDAAAASPMPCAGVVSLLNIEVSAAPTSGKSWQVTLMKNGSTTTLTATISNTATTASDVAHSVTYAAGDTLSLQVIPSGTPTVPLLSWNVDFDSTASANFPVLASTAASTVNSGVRYNLAQGSSGSAWNSTETNVSIIVPSAGTISDFYGLLSGAPGASKSYDFAVMLNGSAQTLAINFTGAAQTTASDTTHSFSVAAGDLISIRCTPTSTPTSVAAGFGLLFTPTTDGESFHSMNTLVSPSSSATNYQSPTGTGATSWNTTEANRNHPFGPVTIKAMFVGCSTAPGAAKSFTYTLRKASADTSTPVAVAISGASQTTNSLTGITETFTQGQKIALKSVPSGTPTFFAPLRVSLVLYNTPTNVSANATTATGTGSASDGDAAIGTSGGSASATGTAFNAKVSIGSPAGAATGTGTAPTPTDALVVGASAATVTVTAYNATANTSGASNAAAGLASASGAAFDATATTMASSSPNAGVATVTGAAFNAAVTVRVTAGGAAATAAALAPSPSVLPNGGAAAATGAALDATATTAGPPLYGQLTATTTLTATPTVIRRGVASFSAEATFQSRILTREAVTRRARRRPRSRF
jgi:hypothetical protein